MYYEVAKQLVLDCPAGATVYEHSQPVGAEGASYVTIEATAYCAGGSGTPSLSVSLQESNDLENWEDTSGLTAIVSPMPAYERSSSSSFPNVSNYYRLEYALQETAGLASTKVMVAAAINVVRAT
jgi:hypothetical protein